MEDHDINALVYAAARRGGKHFINQTKEILAILHQRVMNAEKIAQRSNLKIKVHITEEVKNYLIKELPVNFIEDPVTLRGHEVVIDTINGIELWEEI